MLTISFEDVKLVQVSSSIRKELIDIISIYIKLVEIYWSLLLGVHLVSAWDRPGVDLG